MSAPFGPDKAIQLLPYARTDAERRNLQSIIEAGSMTAAARARGLNRSSIIRCVQQIQSRAAIQGYSPDHDMTHTAPDTHLVKGTSTLYGDDGTPKLQWVKTDLRREKLEQLAEEFIAATAEQIRPEKPRSLKTKRHREELCNLYICTDYHLGDVGLGRGDARR